MLKRLFTTVAVICLATSAAAADLLMVEEEGCFWCAKWNEEIGPIYPKTKEGKFAPLIRTDIDALPATIEFSRSLIYTPTFVLVENGTELGRIEGYPGEDFFLAFGQSNAKRPHSI